MRNEKYDRGARPIECGGFVHYLQSLPPATNASPHLMARLEKQRCQRTVGTYVRVNLLCQSWGDTRAARHMAQYVALGHACLYRSLSLYNQRKLEACTEGRPQELVATSPCVSWAPADGPGGSSPLPPASPELRDCLLVMGKEKPMIWVLFGC